MAKRYDPLLKQKIVQLYNDSVTPYQMVDLLPELMGKKPSTIYGILKAEGVEPRKSIVITQEQKLSRRKYNVNDSYFDDIDSYDKAYWLGFLYADGFVKTSTDVVGISLAQIDRDHLVSFKESVDAESPIKDYVVKQGYLVGSAYSRIQITSHQMKQSLLRLGVLENKTLKLKFPFHLIDPMYYCAFIRGYFDGDGCLTYGSLQKCNDKNFTIKITGTYDLLDGIQQVIGTQVKLDQRYPDRNVDNYSLAIGGNLQVLRVLDLMYQDGELSLNRKKDRYEELKQQCRLRSTL